MEDQIDTTQIPPLTLKIRENRDVYSLVQKRQSYVINLSITNCLYLSITISSTLIPALSLCWAGKWLWRSDVCWRSVERNEITKSQSKANEKSWVESVEVYLYETGSRDHQHSPSTKPDFSFVTYARHLSQLPKLRTKDEVSPTRVRDQNGYGHSCTAVTSNTTLLFPIFFAVAQQKYITCT